MKCFERQLAWIIRLHLWCTDVLAEVSREGKVGRSKGGVELAGEMGGEGRSVKRYIEAGQEVSSYASWAGRCGRERNELAGEIAGW